MLGRILIFNFSWHGNNSSKMYKSLLRRKELHFTKYSYYNFLFSLIIMKRISNENDNLVSFTDTIFMLRNMAEYKKDICSSIIKISNVYEII